MFRDLFPVESASLSTSSRLIKLDDAMLQVDVKKRVAA